MWRVFRRNGNVHKVVAVGPKPTGRDPPGNGRQGPRGSLLKRPSWTQGSEKRNVLLSIKCRAQYRIWRFASSTNACHIVELRGLLLLGDCGSTSTTLRWPQGILILRLSFGRMRLNVWVQRQPARSAFSGQYRPQISRTLLISRETSLDTLYRSTAPWLFDLYFQQTLLSADQAKDRMKTFVLATHSLRGPLNITSHSLLHLSIIFVG